jgi:hypothetical protein
VTPATQRDCDLVCLLRCGVVVSRGGVTPTDRLAARATTPGATTVGATAAVREVVFLDERAGVVVCHPHLCESTPGTLRAVGRRAVVRAVSPVGVLLRDDTGVLRLPALAGELGVGTGVGQCEPTPPVVCQVITPAGVGVRVVDADWCPVRCLFHTCGGDVCYLKATTTAAVLSVTSHRTRGRQN